MQLLLVQGANYHIKDVNGHTPRQVACTNFFVSKLSNNNKNVKRATEDLIDRWPATMAILCLKELSLYHWLDMSLIDLFELIGQEKDFINIARIF